MKNRITVNLENFKTATKHLKSFKKEMKENGISNEDSKEILNFVVGIAEGFASDCCGQGIGFMNMIKTWEEQNEHEAIKSLMEDIGYFVPEGFETSDSMLIKKLLEQKITQDDFNNIYYPVQKYFGEIMDNSFLLGIEMSKNHTGTLIIE
jgi:hypothetical protein